MRIFDLTDLRQGVVARAGQIVPGCWKRLCRCRSRGLDRLRPKPSLIALAELPRCVFYKGCLRGEHLFGKDRDCAFFWLHIWALVAILGVGSLPTGLGKGLLAKPKSLFLK